MRSIGVREFRDQATSILAAGETMVIERHGEPIGFYVPIAATDRQRGAAAMGRLAKVLDEVLAQTGLDEEELAREITPRRRAAR